MNPKGVNDLDPKLRETYERVMGTALNSSSPAAPTGPTQTPSQPPVLKTETIPSSQPVSPASPATPPPPVNPMPSANPPTTAEPALSPQAFKADDPFKDIDPPPAEVLANNAVVSNETKKKRSLKPVMFLVGGLIFFIVYAVVWAVVLGLIKFS